MGAGAAARSGLLPRPLCPSVRAPVGRSVGPSPAAGGAAAGCPPRADTRALARPEVNTPRRPTRKRPRAASRPAARGTPGGVVRARSPGGGSGPPRQSGPLREPRCPSRRAGSVLAGARPIGASEAALARQINVLIRDGTRTWNSHGVARD